MKYYVIYNKLAFECYSHEEAQTVSGNIPNSSIFQSLPSGNYKIVTRDSSPELYAGRFGTNKKNQNSQNLDEVSESSWWDRPNGLDPRYSNRFVTLAVSITLFIFTIIFWNVDSDKSYDMHIQNLKDAKERRLKNQQTEEWFKMMEAHPDAFERK